jgi:hypothetical protein
MINNYTGDESKPWLSRDTWLYPQHHLSRSHVNANASARRRIVKFDRKQSDRERCAGASEIHESDSDSRKRWKSGSE